MEWTYEVHELSEGFSAIVYDEHGRRIADHLTEEQAQLIAAAHDLLEALITAREAIASCDIGAFGWGDADGEPYPLKDELLAKFDAIAKAGGAS